MCVKMRLLVANEEYDELKSYFEKNGIEISDFDFEYTLISNNKTIDKIVGYKDKEMFLIKPDEIMYFESFGNSIICHTLETKYNVKYKLFELENLFNDYDFMRISISFVVNLDQIKSIKPSINTKFTLTMRNQTKVEVTRGYYYQFKEFIEGGKKK